MSMESKRLSAYGRSAELLQMLEAAAVDLHPEELPDLVGALEGFKARLLLRIIARPAEPAQGQEDEDRLVSIEKVAAALRRSKAWVYDNWPSLPFASQRVAGGRIWFSEAGLNEYIRSLGGRLPAQGA